VSRSPLLIPKRGFSLCCVDAINQDVLESLPLKRHRNTLPSLEELPGVLEEPLRDSDKIPIPLDFYESLILFYGSDVCT